MKRKELKHKTKDTVFTYLFNLPKYKRELYLTFHPEDVDIKDTDIETFTITSLFTNIQINDLGLLIKNTLLIMVEAQSIWTINILPRMLEYVAESYNRYLIKTNQNIYSTKKVKLPISELYVIYTGDKQIEEEITLNKEFFNNESNIDIKVKVITLNNTSSIVKEYIEFSKKYDINNKKIGYNKESILKTIDYCINNNILKEFLTENKMEVYNIMTSLYSQELATKMYGNERFAEGREEGMEKGIEKGREEGIEKGIEKGLNILNDLFSKGIITAEQYNESKNELTKR